MFQIRYEVKYNIACLFNEIFLATFMSRAVSARAKIAVGSRVVNK